MKLNNKIYTLIVVCFSIILFISGCSNSENASTDKGNTNKSDTKKTVIQIGYPLSKGTISDESAKLFKELVEEKVGDDVEIQLFPDGQLGSDVAVLEGLRIGTHDATIIATPITTIDPKFSFMDLPYLFTTKEDVEKITKGPIGKELMDGLEKYDIKGLGYWNSGWRHVTTNDKQIINPEDLNGLKIRVPSSPSRVQLFKLLGANPTPLAFSELFSALEQNVVDGQENPIYILESSKLYEVQKNLSLTKHVYSSNYILFGKAKWDSYSSEVQNALQEAADIVADNSWEIDDELTKKSLEAVKEHMQVNEVDIEKFKEAANPIYSNSEFIEPIGEELMEEVLSTLGRN